MITAGPLAVIMHFVNGLLRRLFAVLLDSRLNHEIR